MDNDSANKFNDKPPADDSPTTAEIIYADLSVYLSEHDVVFEWQSEVVKDMIREADPVQFRDQFAELVKLSNPEAFQAAMVRLIQALDVFQDFKEEVDGQDGQGEL